jgi:hypothetical protein
MKRTLGLLFVCVIIGGAFWANPCVSQDYDTQKGAIGGARASQAIGRDTPDAMMGAADGMLVGAMASAYLQ